MNVTDRTVLVAGLGVSGAAAARVLLDRGARVLLTDATEPAAVAGLTGAGATWLGGIDSVPEGIDLVVTSPGWRPDAPLLVDAARRGIEVVGEPELAWRLRIAGPDGVPAPWLAVTSQNRTMTVFSVHPASSKWWCSGAIRNTRRRVARKNATWITTDSVMATNSPPRTTRSSSVRVTMANPAIRPPSASEPVSPMKIRAGLVFHHRKPRHAPRPAAATRVTSSGSRTV